MGSKNVSLRSEVYEWLKAEKREDESFSDVVARLLRENRDLDAGAGLWEGTAKAEVARERRDDLEGRLLWDVAEIAESSGDEGGGSDG